MLTQEPTLKFLSRHIGKWLLLVIIIITAAVYAPGLFGGWLFDDYPNIVDNEVVHVTDSSLANWKRAALASPSDLLKRPLAMLSFAVNFYFTGLNPFWFKLTNLCIHLFNGLLLYLLLHKLLLLWREKIPVRAMSLTDAQLRWLAILCSGAWLLAPINLTAVLYVVQRMTSLAQTFVLAGLLCYVQGRARQLRGDGGWGWILAGLGGGIALGFTAKETVILLPAYALALELCLLGFYDYRQQRSSLLMVLFVVTVLIPALVALLWLLPNSMHGGYASRPFTLTERLLTELRVVTHYIQWTLLPAPDSLSFYHDNLRVSIGWLSPPGTLACAVLLGGLVTASLACIRRVPLVALGLMWFFIPHLLTGTFIPLELVFEHRNYFASIGLLLAVPALLLKLGRVSTLRLGAGLLCLTLIAWPAAVTLMRSMAWSSPLRLAFVQAQARPDSPRAQYGLARALIIASDYGKKSPELLDKAREILRRTMRMPGADIQPESALILIAGHTGTLLNPAWWRSVITKLKQHPPDSEDLSAIHSIWICQIKGPCKIQVQPMLAVFLSAIGDRHPSAQLLVDYAQFAAFALQDWKLAYRLADSALEISHNADFVHEALVNILHRGSGENL